MKRSNVNFTVDCLGFAAFVLLTATGVLMRYVLPPGSGRSTTIWGLDRHEWGDIHFWIAIAFFAALALHLFLHWRWIVALMSGRPREGSGARVALGTLGLATCLALAISPFLSPVERAGGEHAAPHPHSYEVEDLESIRGKGIRLIDESPRKGAHGMNIAFLHPKSTGKVLTEICQKSP